MNYSKSAPCENVSFLQFSFHSFSNSNVCRVCVRASQKTRILNKTVNQNSYLLVSDPSVFGEKGAFKQIHVFINCAYLSIAQEDAYYPHTAYYPFVQMSI